MGHHLFDECNVRLNIHAETKSYDDAYLNSRTDGSEYASVVIDEYAS
jgi:hypothetical protein